MGSKRKGYFAASNKETGYIQHLELNVEIRNENGFYSGDQTKMISKCYKEAIPI